jgi:hypothetical protein
VADTITAKTRNVIDMAIRFSVMGRVFKPDSLRLISRRLEKLLGQFGKQDFEELHSSFCRWFMKTIKTTSGSPPSYGQAAKVLDVSLKVIVYYCHLPQASVAAKLIPRLYSPIDTPIMLYLKRKYHVGKGLFSLSHVNKDAYRELQSLLNKEAEEVGLSGVEYDDILWRRLSR